MNSSASAIDCKRLADAIDPNPIRLAYLVTHPIQYQVPFLRRIAQEPGIALTVFFGSDLSVRGYLDEGFGVEVKWDVPLLEGYAYEFLPRIRDTGSTGIFSPLCHGLFRRLQGSGSRPAFDALWVHGYSTVLEVYGILAARLAGIPVLVRSDSSLIDRSRGRLKLGLKQAYFSALRLLIDGVLVSGTRNIEYWQQYLGPDFPMFQVPYAVDNEWFQRACGLATRTRAELQDDLNLSPGRPVILFASKLQTRKNCADLIAAYQMLADRPGIDPLPYLLIVGDGEERKALERQAAATGLSSIRFCGFRNQSELPRFYELCTVFVLPARHEPWGLVVNEVMNAAKPVIVSDEVGCQPDLVTDGVEGCVFPVGDIKALAQSLRSILQSPGKAEEMGEHALRRIQTWGFEAGVIGLQHALAGVTGKDFPSVRVPDNRAQLSGSRRVAERAGRG